MGRKCACSLVLVVLCLLAVQAASAVEAVPSPAVDVGIWVRPNQAAPGQMVLIGGHVTNTGNVRDAVTLTVFVSDGTARKVVYTTQFYLGAGESARFQRSWRIPLSAKPGTVLIVGAVAQSRRGARDTSYARLLVTR